MAKDTTPKTSSQEWEEKVWNEVITMIVHAVPVGNYAELMNALREKYTIGKN